MAYPRISTDPAAVASDAPSVPASPRFPEIEKRILDYWAQDATFQASIEQRDPGPHGENEFVFYDGPPFANGLPHYGHLLTGYVKDVIPRYQSMRGKRVDRRFGWDTHGLPAELEAMRLNGIKTTDEILELGIEKFNAACRESVMKYTGEWRDYVTRQARWVDFDHDYRTMNPDYMESVIWAFKSIYDKGWIYEGFRVLPYCWNDETPLSNHELRMDDDVYKNRQDPAVTVGFTLEDSGTDPVLDGAHVLIWTTTAWTLPSNLAVMVGSQIDYVVVEAATPGTESTARYLIAKARLLHYARELGEEPVVLGEYRGADLVGRRYAPPFSYFADHERAFRIVAADDAVTTTDGTGIVHSAGAFGEVDKEVTDREGIEPVMPVGKNGRFTAPVLDYEGMQVFDANAFIIDHLRAATRGEANRGSVTAGTILLRRETYDHSYPHCWRCREPLIYKGVESWFVEVSAFKDRMVELNQQITWVPEHVRDGQFGKWLENARDWSITRNRFWGSPVPVWKSDDPAYPRLDVYGSFAELERDFGAVARDPHGNPDLHRPYVDQLTRPNPDDPTGRSTMRRVPDVLDVWFDSGSMSFAQVHYPFDNEHWFQDHFPGDFIVEYVGQTRGWFYTLHVLATALFDKPAFNSCICHGIVLGNDGQKMSKSLRNYPDVTEVFDRDGADAMRWFLMSSPILRGGNLIVTEEGIRDAVRQVQIPLWNSWSFFALYANAFGDGQGYAARSSTSSTAVLDRYILAKLRLLVQTATTQLDSLDVAGACESVRSFIDVLTNWYIRRSRQRFWGTGEQSETDTRAAFDTLFTTLEVLTRVSAPLLPMITEEIWRGLTGGRSVHLSDWPAVDELPADDQLVARMDQARAVCSVASSLRKAHNLRVRLPLRGVRVVVPDAAGLQEFAAIIADEVNVRQVSLLDLDVVSESDFGVSQRLTVNARAAGPRLGADVQKAIKASKTGHWSLDDQGQVVSGGLVLHDGEYTIDTVISGAGEGQASAVVPGGGFVVLDTVLTPDLAAEGLARDVVRAVQQARREAGLNVSDRISLTVTGSPAVWEATVAHQDLIVEETLTTQFGSAPDLEQLPAGDGVSETMVGDGERIRIKVTASTARS